MDITHVLPVVPVVDFDGATAWYARLLGRPADRRPMAGLADWEIPSCGWLQIVEKPEHAGGTTVNLAVADLDAALAEIDGREVEHGDALEVSGGVRLASLTDPAGNTITLVQPADG